MLFTFKDFTENAVFLTAVAFRGLIKYISDTPPPPKFKQKLKCVFFYQPEFITMAYKISYLKNPSVKMKV